MSIKKRMAACLAAAVGFFVLTGCSHGQSAGLANEITFSLDGISEVTISYDEEKVTFYESENDELTIKEYMTKSKSSYYAKVDQSSDSIKVSEGGKPFFKDGFSRHIEVYLPASYYENLTVTTTDGDVDISKIQMSLNTLRMDSTAGTICLNTVKAQNIYLSDTGGVIEADYLKADTIRIDTTDGSFFCKKLEGDVTYTTTSGNADVKSAVGEGDYKADNSGELNVIYSEVTGDLSFYNKNDAVDVTLPDDLEFEFEATTKNGRISTTFGEELSIEGRTAKGAIGQHPTVTVKVETKNGDIEVKQ